MVQHAQFEHPRLVTRLPMVEKTSWSDPMSRPIVLTAVAHGLSWDTDTTVYSSWSWLPGLGSDLVQWDCSDWTDWTGQDHIMGRLRKYLATTSYDLSYTARAARVVSSIKRWEDLRSTNTEKSQNRPINRDIIRNTPKTTGESLEIHIKYKNRWCMYSLSRKN